MLGKLIQIVLLGLLLVLLLAPGKLGRWSLGLGRWLAGGGRPRARGVAGTGQWVPTSGGESVHVVGRSTPPRRGKFPWPGR